MSVRKNFSVIIAAVLLLTFLTGCSSDEEEPGISRIDWDDHDQRAEQFVMTLLNGDYTIAAEGFDEEMVNALGVSGLRRAWISTVRVAGEFISIVRTEFVPHDEYEIYNVISQHKNRDIVTRIVFSPDGTIAGLFFSYN